MTRSSLLSAASSPGVPGTIGLPPRAPGQMSLPPGCPIPVLVPMPKGPATFGPSRSELYRAGAEEPGLLVKIGSRTYIVSAVMLARIERLKKLVPKRDPRRAGSR